MQLTTTSSTGQESDMHWLILLTEHGTIAWDRAFWYTVPLLKLLPSELCCKFSPSHSLGTFPNCLHPYFFTFYFLYWCLANFISALSPTQHLPLCNQKSLPIPKETLVVAVRHVHHCLGWVTAGFHFLLVIWVNNACGLWLK